MAYLITYDLCKPGQNYNDLTTAITSYPGYCKLSESSWVVTSTKTSSEIRDHLTSYLDKNDVLFVGKLSGEADWIGEPEKVTKWLKANL